MSSFTVAQLRPPPVPRPGARPARSAAGVPGGARPPSAADAPVVPQDVPQLQLAAAAAEALPRTGGGAGLQQLVGRAQAGAGGAAAPGRSLRGSIDIMLLYQYACACGQPVIGGLPLQHAQRALLLSCELRRLNRWSLWWCLSRCWCLRVCLRRLKWRRLWLALWSSRLSRHVLLRFVLAPRGLPRRFGSGAACSGAACTSASCASASCAGASCSVGSI